jgi:hypothetical protein
VNPASGGSSPGNTGATSLSTPAGLPMSTFGAPPEAPFRPPAEPPFGGPSGASFGTAGETPFGMPAAGPFGAPSEAPFGTPGDSPFGTSSEAPFGTPGEAPFGGPQSFGGVSGPHQTGDFAPEPPFGEPPRPRPILPLTSESHAGSAPWPLASADDLRDQAIDLSRDLSHDRLANLANHAGQAGQTGQAGLAGQATRTGASERLTRSRRRPDDSGNGWFNDGRPTPRLLVTLLGVAAAAGAVVLVLTVGGDPPPAPQVATPAISAPAVTDILPPAIPDGYKEQAPDGFTAAIPADWKNASSGGVATFTGPADSGMTIKVAKATPQDDGGLAELGKEEAAGGVDGYIQVQLQAAHYRTWKAADWEYTYTLSNGVPMHTLTRYLSIDATTAFKITMDMPELKWDDQGETRQVFFDTFRRDA